MAGRPKHVEVDGRLSMTVAELVRLIAALSKDRREALARELERQALIGMKGKGERFEH
jgi:hypothetical protein